MIAALAIATVLGQAKEEPKIEFKRAQYYAAIAETVKIDELGPSIPKLAMEAEAWCKAHKLKVGDSLIRYRVIDMERSLQIEVGFNLDHKAKGDKRVICSNMPAGRYVTVVHTGLSTMIQANGDLQDWAAKKGLKFAVKGNTWSGRVEYYQTDPAKEPDMNKWKVEIAYALQKNYK